MKTTTVALAIFWLAVTACGPKPANEKTHASASPAKQAMNTASTDSDTHAFSGHLPVNFEMPPDEVGQRLLKEYGAMFVARGVAVGKVVVFKDSAAVTAFQSSTPTLLEAVGGVNIELQESAMSALKGAINEASSSGLSITPRGADSAKRSYDDTVDLWKSRVDPGLDHWVSAGRITPDDAKRIRAMTPFEQVPEIFRLEDQGIFFSKDLSKPIIYSVAPPGASQHLSMLALDVTEFDNAAVREILAKHGWFQTVVSDLPHFTYLGAHEDELPGLGLKKVTNGDRAFWVPDL